MNQIFLQAYTGVSHNVMSKTFGSVGKALAKWHELILAVYPTINTQYGVMASQWNLS